MTYDLLASIIMPLLETCKLSSVTAEMCKIRKFNLSFGVSVFDDNGDIIVHRGGRTDSESGHRCDGRCIDSGT